MARPVTHGPSYVPAMSTLPAMKRIMRRPQHTWTVRHEPFALQPIAIIPVLPGDSLKAFSWQCRSVLDPIKARLSGWWLEHYWFYVKHRDLSAISGTLQDMMINPQASTSAAYSGARTITYNQGATTAIDFTYHCMIECVKWYFRVDDEAWNFAVDSLNTPYAQIGMPGWWDSLCKASDIAAQDIALTVGVDDVITASEVENMMSQWELLRSQGVIGDITYEDYLRSYGVSIPQASPSPGKPELLRVTRDWSYPVNTVEPTTGVPTSAVSWAIQEKADKNRFFSEPGFIFGLECVRPKIFSSAQKTAAAHWMLDAYRWIPAVLANDIRTSLVKFTAGTGPLPGLTADYVVDFRDLLLYGDQFTNVDLTAVTGMSALALPEVTGQRKYPTAALIDTLFVTPVTKRYLYSDGICKADIASRVTDFTPTLQ